MATTVCQKLMRVRFNCPLSLKKNKLNNLRTTYKINNKKKNKDTVVPSQFFWVQNQID